MSEKIIKVNGCCNGNGKKSPTKESKPSIEVPLDADASGVSSVMWSIERDEAHDKRLIDFEKQVWKKRKNGSEGNLTNMPMDF
jgi:hypothetical protein